MARTLGESVGETIGLRARLISKTGPKTRIEVITEGVFTRSVMGGFRAGNPAELIRK